METDTQQARTWCHPSRGGCESGYRSGGSNQSKNDLHDYFIFYKLGTTDLDQLQQQKEITDCWSHQHNNNKTTRIVSRQLLACVHVEDQGSRR